jgi:phosphatidylglycerophosphatase A
VKPRLDLLRSPWGWIATGLGSGLSPKAPGTVGTVAALPLVGLLLWAAVPAWVYGLVTLALFGLGCVAAQRVIDRIGIDDPGCVVIDEWVGLLLTVGLPWHLFVALGEPPSLPLTLVAGFLLFRLTDIAKPWPANCIDAALGGGFGAMADDAVAGLQAAGLLALVLWIWP